VFSMQNQAKLNSSKQKNQANPFANALAEMEKAPSSPRKTKDNSFGEALAKTGSDLSADIDPKELQQNQLKDQEKKLEKEALRKKLHDQVNPVDQIDIFNAREQKVNKQLEKTRKELKVLSKEISKFHKEVDIIVTQKVVNPGQEGKYHSSFFGKLRQIIMMLTAQVKSARVWAQKNAAKARKQKQGKQPGLEMKGVNKTEAVHNMLDNNELNNAFGD